MNLTAAGPKRLAAILERIDARSLRERALLFGGAIILVCLAWQHLLMDPLDARARRAAMQLEESRRQLASLEQIGSLSTSDPVILAASRNQALRNQVATLDGQLRELARDCIGPQRVTEMLRAMLASQQGLALVSLRNLPAESLSPARHAREGAADPARQDPGPFLHPVELVFEGDYASVTAYTHALEQLPWHIHWQRLEISAREYPVNRVRLVVGAVSLSRDWIEL